MVRGADMGLEMEQTNQHHRLLQVMELVAKAEAGLRRSRSLMMLQTWKNIQAYVESSHATE